MKSLFLLLSCIVVLITVLAGIGLFYLTMTSEVSRTAETPPASATAR